jgi:hypothetical protein
MNFKPTAMKQLTGTLLLTLISLTLWAQQGFDISGTVKDEKGAALASVTVFIDGSNKYTMTDVNGHYAFAGIQSGTYRVVTSMVGRGSERSMVNVRDKAVTANFVLKVKPTELNEVVIGSDSRRTEMLRIFTRKFIGLTENAKSCTIINPKIIEFTTNKNILLATTPDFLIIENKNLGYRIKYLVKIFRYDRGLNITSYTGDCIFEELPGNNRQKREWLENRKAAYEGSFMHYLRQLYSRSKDDSWFRSYAVDSIDKTTVNPEPVDMTQYITRIDSNFIKLAFKQTLRVAYRYENKKAIAIKHDGTGDSLDDKIKMIHEATAKLDLQSMAGKVGQVTMYLNNTIVDRNGNYLDYRSFLLEGLWNQLQVGDRLPFTYQP